MWGDVYTDYLPICVNPTLYLKTNTTEFRIRSNRKVKADLIIKYTQQEKIQAAMFLKDGLVCHEDMKTDFC